MPCAPARRPPGGTAAAGNVCRPAGHVQLQLTDPRLDAWWCGFGADGGPDVCHCVRCGIDMGARNPRQLCGKWRCRGAGFLHTSDVSADDSNCMVLVEETDYDSVGGSDDTPVLCTM